MVENVHKVGEDRAAVLARGDTTVIILADGSSQSSFGAEAAEMVVRLVDELCTDTRGWEHPSAWIKLLEHVDQRVTQAQSVGESTAVVVMLDAEHVVGASIGDSVAWLIDAAHTRDLTQRQRITPLIGTGRAPVVGFGPAKRHDASLLVASDGLVNFASRHRIESLIREHEPPVVLDTLLDFLRMPSGELMADVSIVLIQSQDG